jgi:hypothetical protein
MTARSRRQDRAETSQRIGVDLGCLRRRRPAEFALRFGFGAGIALAAALISLRFGARAGGIFLAFPAILPASLSMIEHDDGNERAVIDSIGAILGSLALVACAVVATLALPRTGAVAGVGLVLAAWLVVAAVLYLVASRTLRALGVAPSPPGELRRQDHDGHEWPATSHRRSAAK